MKIHVWDHEVGFFSTRLAASPARPKRKTVAQILRAAYRKHVRDAHTRQAVKHCLR
jgi:hypothetical protein